MEVEDGVWEDVYTLILPEDCDNYSFGLYSDTHDKQFYWDGNEFIEEFSNSEIYNFNEIENLQFAYNGYSADLPVRVLDLRLTQHSNIVLLTLNMAAILHQRILIYMLPPMTNMND